MTACGRCGGLTERESIPFSGVTARRCVICGRVSEYRGLDPETLGTLKSDARLAKVRAEEKTRAEEKALLKLIGDEGLPRVSR